MFSGIERAVPPRRISSRTLTDIFLTYATDFAKMEGLLAI